MQPEIRTTYTDKMTGFTGICTHWTQYADRIEAYLESEHGARYFDMRRLAGTAAPAAAAPDATAHPDPAPVTQPDAPEPEMSVDDLRAKVKAVMEAANTMDTALLRNQLMVFGAPTIPKLDPARRGEFLNAVATSYGVKI